MCFCTSIAKECVSISLSQGRHGIMKIESTAVMSNPKADPHTILIHGQPLTEVKPTRSTAPCFRQLMSSPAGVSYTNGQSFTALIHPQVVVEAVFSQKPSALVKVFIIVVSLILGLVILAALVWCLWKVNIFVFVLQTTTEVWSVPTWHYRRANKLLLITKFWYPWQHSTRTTTIVQWQ